MPRVDIKSAQVLRNASNNVVRISVNEPSPGTYWKGGKVLDGEQRFSPMSPA
jgi:hypothetical protein